MAALRSLYDPASVAVVGASDDTRKWGNWLAQSALRGERRRVVALVNGRGGTVLGRAAYASLAELAAPVELAVIAVRPAAVPTVVDEALAAGARAIVVISSFVGTLTDRRAQEVELATRVRAAGAILLGPNCLGVFDASTELELVPAALPRGSIGFVSQSGNIGLELGRLAEARGLGFSRFVSTGNQAGIDGATALRSLLEHQQTQLIAVYLEDLSNPGALAEAAVAAGERGKPVLLMAPERSRATSRVVASHTGSVPAARAELDELCRAGGIERAADPSELIEAAAAALRRPSPRDRGWRSSDGPEPHPGARAKRDRPSVAIVADGGGHAALATTLAERAGLRVPRFSERLVTQLRPRLTETAAVDNPIDLAGAGERDIRSFDRAAAAVMRSGEVAGILVAGCFGGYQDYSERFAEDELRGARALAASAAATGRALSVHTMYPDSPAADVLRDHGVFVGGSLKQAVSQLAGLLSARG